MSLYRRLMQVMTMCSKMDVLLHTNTTLSTYQRFIRITILFMKTTGVNRIFLDSIKYKKMQKVRGTDIPVLEAPTLLLANEHLRGVQLISALCYPIEHTTIKARAVNKC